MKKRAAFKPYEQHQLSLLPMNLEEMIPQNHLVRVVDRAIEKMNTKPLFDRYEGGGASAYNPVMMLKVVVYAYATKIYSSRQIAKATRENINFLWLTGCTQLDFMTINRFRSERLKGIIEKIFTEIVALLLEEKYIKFKNYFLDGTKIEANANKYSWVWGKSTHMRMKEDHMKNGQLKPGYNVQIGTENQFITGYSIHQKPTDWTTLKPHLEQLEKQMGRLPKNVIADAGYGSEENYEFLEENNIVPYVKYGTFHKENSKKWREDPTKTQNFSYDENTDTYYCTMGRPFVFLYEKNSKSENNYKSRVRVYECLNCSGCPHREKCVKAEYGFANRRIYINRRLNELKQNAKELLLSETGKEMRSKRPIEVETVFGNIKGNFGVRRFMLRGLQKVSIEWALCSIAHNMRKMAAAMG